MTTTTALVATGIVTICCGTHRPNCCDPDDCGPCCPECPTCPTLQSWTPVERRHAAAERRQLWANAIHMHRAARTTWLEAQQALNEKVASGSATPIFDEIAAQYGVHPDPAPVVWSDADEPADVLSGELSWTEPGAPPGEVSPRG